MDLKREILYVPLEDRVVYNRDKNILFVNFENFSVRSSEEIQSFRKLIASTLDPSGKKVTVVLNYDGFDLLPELFDDFLDAAQDIGDTYSEKAIRYTTSTFMRMKLGDSLKNRGISPHIYECAIEAHAAAIGDAKN